MIRELPEKWKHLRTSEEIHKYLNSREYWESRRNGDPLDDEIIELDFSKYFGAAFASTILSAGAIVRGRFGGMAYRLPNDVQLRIRKAIDTHYELLKDRAKHKDCWVCKWRAEHDTKPVECWSGCILCSVHFS